MGKSAKNRFTRLTIPKCKRRTRQLRGTPTRGLDKNRRAFVRDALADYANVHKIQYAP